MIKKTAIRYKGLLLFVTFMSLSLTAMLLHAAGWDNGEFAKAVQNPIANMVSLPFQENINFNTGPQGGVQNVLNIQPVIPVQPGPGIADPPPGSVPVAEVRQNENTPANETSRRGRSGQSSSMNNQTRSMLQTPQRYPLAG